LATGDRTSNSTSAIAFYEAALRVYTEEEFPLDWARVQYNLGDAWIEFPAGDRAANLAKAIAHSEAALRVYSEREWPQQWAATQNNLGNAWAWLSTGDRSANLEKAIAYYEAALRVFTEHEFPEDWAMVKRNLRYAWRDLRNQARTENAMSTNNPDDNFLLETESTGATLSPSAATDSPDSNETILNGVRFVKTSDKSPISWFYPGFGGPKSHS
jgi:tetratricopeptide (TPR) repeat protein